MTLDLFSPSFVYMKLFSWNIRGLCGSGRQRVVRSWLQSLGLSVGVLLETHVQEENLGSVLGSVAPGWRFDHNYSEASGGRIWLLWSQAVSVVVYKRTDQLILCGVLDPATGTSCSVAFVYARNTEAERRELWKDLVSLSNNPLVAAAPLVVLGDFNQILTAAEHFSLFPYDLPVRGMEEFQLCLSESCLADLDIRGTFFLWSNRRPEDPILRKLDRVLCNDKWRELYPNAVSIFEPPGDSDHCPAVVSFSDIPATRKCSFKYFSFISSHPSFAAEMLKTWEEEIQVGSKLFSLGQRLKKAKATCRRLNREGFGNIQQRAADSLAALKEIQQQLLNDPTDTLFRQEFVARRKWQFFEEAQEIFFKRKARIRWLDCGDSNTKFFYKMVVAHQARNFINYLLDGGGNRVFNRDQIKEMIVTYFHNLLGTEDDWIQQISSDDLNGLLSYRCPASISNQLISIPTVEEIKSTLFSMKKNKAPGPDGFSAEFFWESWEIVGRDTVEAIKEFFTGSRMLRQFNSTIISLIPKFVGADQLSAFRPISLCTTVYKVMARLLKKKLQLCVSDIVQRNQVGFVQDRLLCENVLLATELVKDFHAQGPTTRGCLKIDISKAFDNLNWDFLFKVLNTLELPTIFIDWIKECVTSTSFSVAINGELHGFFPGKKGLRQGDPISSLLFVIAMDVLSKMLDAGAVRGRFGIHPECDAPLITHLSFADDLLIFFDGAEESLRGILHILEEFRLVSGLKINRQKSELLLDGGSSSRCREMASQLGMAQGALPLRYLGVPLSPKKMTRTDFQPLLDKIAARFNSWTVKHLSFAGRFQLIQAVIYSTISFWASMFIIPMECVIILERMCGAFLWNGAPNSARGAKIAWDSVCTPRVVGGLGLKRLADWNKVLGLKLIWLLFTAGGSLWVSWVRRNLMGTENFWVLDASRSGSWIWRALCKLRPLARPMIHCEVGSGITASFWHDNWTSFGPLIDIVGERGPQITGLSIDAVVADALSSDGWWLERSRSRSRTISILKECLPDAQAIINSEADDTYVWYPGVTRGSGCFSTSETWRALHPLPPEVFWHKAVWFTGRIPKHAFIAWVAARDRMVTRDKLIGWGLNVPHSCVLCQVHDESRQHLFFDCAYSNTIWSFFLAKMRVRAPNGFNDVLRWLLAPSRNKNETLILRLIHQAVIYLTWKERNTRIHTAVEKPAGIVIAEIQQIIRLRLDPIARRQTPTQGLPSVLASWLSFFNS